MAVYLKASSMVSAQDTLNRSDMPENLVNAENSALKTRPCNYKDYLPAASLRRMSRIVKFSLVSAFDCLNQLEDFTPDAIITSTGLGCLEDTITFLTQMHQNEEKLMNPSSFIGSTHNSIGGQIALLKKLRIPNLTHTQMEGSFESALIDAMMMLEDGEANNILVGGFDEITPETILLWKNMGCLSENEVNRETLVNSTNKGIIPGEGAGFFALSKNKDQSSKVKLCGIRIRHSYNGGLNVAVSEFLSEYDMKPGDIDLLILGVDGTPDTHTLLNLTNNDFENATVAAFKHLSGSFNTDTTFAFWLAGCAIVNGKIHPECCLKGANIRKFKHVLLVNSSKAGNFTFIYLNDDLE